MKIQKGIKWQGCVLWDSINGNKSCKIYYVHLKTIHDNMCYISKSKKVSTDKGGFYEISNMENKVTKFNVHLKVVYENPKKKVSTDEGWNLWNNIASRNKKVEKSWWDCKKLAQ